MKARNRPPRLDGPTPAPVGARATAPEPSPAELLVRARLAGKVSSPGPSELRHAVERLETNPVDTWAAIRAVFGATPDAAQIDPERTLRAARVAAVRLGAVAHAGGRIAFATAQPASLLGMYAALGRSTSEIGATIDDADDSAPLRIDGRTGRFLRWIDRVAVVTDGTSVLATTGADAADEWLFLVGRPALVVADGAFAAAAVGAGLDTVAFTGLERIDLATPALETKHCLVVPVHSGRPARAYNALLSLLAAGLREHDTQPEAEL
jgi:hypothetical protein